MDVRQCIISGDRHKTASVGNAVWLQLTLINVQSNVAADCTVRPRRPRAHVARRARLMRSKTPRRALSVDQDPITANVSPLQSPELDIVVPVTASRTPGSYELWFTPADVGDHVVNIYVGAKAIPSFVIPVVAAPGTVPARRLKKGINAVYSLHWESRS